jgi:DNA-binding transcriptional LysR family regulator
VLSDTVDDPRLIEWLAQGRLDLAVTLNQQPDDRVEVIPRYDDPWVILTRRDSSLASPERPSFDLLDGADVVAWTSRARCGHRSGADSGLPTRPRAAHGAVTPAPVGR